MITDLHGIPIDFESDDERIVGRWRRQWSSFPSSGGATSSAGESDQPVSPLRLRLNAVLETPPPPQMLIVSQGPTLTYFREGDHFTAYFQRWGRYDIDLEAGEVVGAMTEIGLETYGVFEDMIIISLAPLLRRRGLFTIHAFAAAKQGRAAVIIGDMGAGKTTTGLSLLCDGYRFVSNDSPLLAPTGDGGLELAAYPGLISAYADSLSWFPSLKSLSITDMPADVKTSFAADEVWPDPWLLRATPGILLFPAIEPGLSRSSLTPLPAMTALRRLVGQSIENWDAATMPGHLAALRALAATAPAYELHLAPDVDHIPRLISDTLADTQ